MNKKWQRSTRFIIFILSITFHNVSASLHRKWWNRTLGPLATVVLESQQQHCGVNPVQYTMEPSGMGSDLHGLTLALCYAMSQVIRVASFLFKFNLGDFSSPTKNMALVVHGHWAWADVSLCSKNVLEQPLACYFGDLGCAVRSLGSGPIIRRHGSRCKVRLS
jgi:hypothetical protein